MMKIARILSLTVIAFYIIMTVAYAITAKGKENPIIKFEFVRNVKDTEKIFLKNDQIDTVLIKAINLTNEIDFAFALSYGIFLVFFFVAAKKISGKKFFLQASAFSALAVIFDFLENIQLLKITSSLGNANPEKNIQALQIFTWSKWILLTLILLYGSFFIIKNFNGKVKIFAILTTLPPLSLIYVSFDYQAVSIWALSIFVGIITLIIISWLPQKRIFNTKNFSN